MLDRIKQFFSRIKRRGVFIFIVEDVRMRWHIVFFVFVVIAFGIAYMCLTPQGDGIGQNSTPLFEVYTFVTFLNGIYFSVITVSSLGYGDMHPMGFSKALICMEVLMGLALIGIMIAKVTSRRLTHHVERLFSSDAQKRLEEIAAKFDTFQVDLKAIMPKLTAAYQSTPRQTSPPTEDRSALIVRFRKIISDLKLKCIELREYLSNEMLQSNYFQIAPVGAVERVGNASDETFFSLGLLIRSLPSQSKAWEEILERDNRQSILEAINSQKQVCELVGQHATDQRILDAFQHIKETCAQLQASYFTVPEVPEELQADHIPQGADEPQELSEVDDEHTGSS